MAKTVSFDYKDTHYTLGFNRNTAVLLEKQGFTPEELTSKPNVMIPMLFTASFQQYHRGTKRERIDEIYEKMPNKNDLLLALVEAYAETGNSLFDEPKGDEGNLTWEQNG